MSPITADRRADPASDAWTPQTLALARDLKAGLPPVGPARREGGLDFRAHLGSDSLWLIIRSPEGLGMALRTAHAEEGGLGEAKAESEGVGAAAYAASAAAATFRVTASSPGNRLLRVTTYLTPKRPLLIPFWPRDLYPLGPGDDPTAAKGQVMAAQRGFNAGVCFFKQPAGAVLYFQNLTALNPWFKATGTKPDGVVGGQWPELGYQPPSAPNAPSPPEKPLRAGVEVVLSDAFIYVAEAPPSDETEEASIFLDGLAAICPSIEKPRTQYRDWPGMARRTLAALSRSPKTSVTRYDRKFVRPYTNAEVPDSMVQMAVLLPVREWGAWRGRPSDLEQELRAGMGRFFDPELGSVRRYLPNIAARTETIPKAKDKDPDEVDSWYLYHPLANFGRLALEGDKEAARIFLGSLDFSIKVARHFKYSWPVLFNVMSLAVSVEERKPGAPGQSDVGGLYAYVMIQAHELTGDGRFLEEAVNAVRATRNLGFDLLYQTNLTAWGVMACLKLWKITADDFYLRRSKVFLAGFFHNTIFWESEIAAAAHYQTYLGATCLHDGPYMAIYECFESFAAFRDYLEAVGDVLPDSVCQLLNEYCRHALTRAWGFYPGELPRAVIAKDQRNGEVDASLALPVEDLYADGQPPGQVGQEVYGAGAALVFTARSYHRRRGMPFTVFCDYPLKPGPGAPGEWNTQVAGWRGGTCRLRIMARRGGDLPKFTVRIDGKARPGRTISNDAWEAEVSGTSEISIRWEREANHATRRPIVRQP